MAAACIWKTPKPTILHTPQHFGASTDASPTPPDRSSGDPYREIAEECYALLARKRGYYGCADDPLENALGVRDQGITPWVYQAARIGEKLRRLRGPLSDTDLEDTLYDIMGHAAVAIATLRRLASPGQIPEPGDGQQ